MIFRKRPRKFCLSCCCYCYCCCCYRCCCCCCLHSESFLPSMRIHHILIPYWLLFLGEVNDPNATLISKVLLIIIIVNRDNNKIVIIILVIRLILSNTKILMNNKPNAGRSRFLSKPSGGPFSSRGWVRR